jgi:hypothetical protein
VGSLLFDGVRFVVYSNDHPPRHVHGFASGIEVIVDLRLDGNVALGSRRDAIRSSNAKVSEVRKILTLAAENFESLTKLWEHTHGKT